MAASVRCGPGVHRHHPNALGVAGGVPTLRFPDGPICRIEVSEPWVTGLDGIEAFERLEVLYWLHQSRRDLVRQSPGNDGATRGTFTIRSPVRPNPIGTSIVTLVNREGPALNVRGLDCVDGTPLLDLKPDRSQFRSR